MEALRHVRTARLATDGVQTVLLHNPLHLLELSGAGNPNLQPFGFTENIFQKQRSLISMDPLIHEDVCIYFLKQAALAFEQLIGLISEEMFMTLHLVCL